MVVMVTLAGGSVVLVHEYSELLEIQFVVPVIIPLLNQPAYAQLPARNMMYSTVQYSTVQYSTVVPVIIPLLNQPAYAQLPARNIPH